MKLFEIFKMDEDFAQSFEMTPSDDLDKFIKPEYSAKIGTFDGYDIWGSRFYGEKLDTYCILGENNIPKALVVIQTKEKLYDGVKCQQIEKVWVDKNSRGKSLTTIILGFIVIKSKTNLISNKIVTQDGKKFYQKLLSKPIFKFRYFDTSDESVSIAKPADIFDFPNPWQIILTYENYSMGDQFNSLHESPAKDLWVFRKWEER